MGDIGRIGECRRKNAVVRMSAEKYMAMLSGIRDVVRNKDTKPLVRSCLRAYRARGRRRIRCGRIELDADSHGLFFRLYDKYVR